MSVALVVLLSLWLCMFAVCGVGCVTEPVVVYV